MAMLRFFLLAGFVAASAAVLKWAPLPSAQEMQRECAKRARAVADSQLKSHRDRNAELIERQAYRACIADPAAFRQLTRGAS